jgi:hypothetical protein
MRSFAARSVEPELMEADDVTPDDLAACLKDLATVNSLTRARPPTLAWLARATGRSPCQGFTLLDVGFGQGDMLRAIHTWAESAGLPHRLTGVDLSPWSAPAAQAATDPAAGIEFLVGDVFDYAPAEPADYVISSLVAHHMSDAQLVRFIRWMEETARRGWFINDLHRHPIAFYSFAAISTVAGWHRFVRHDGPVSVARAFRRRDWERLLAEAGVPAGAASIDWRFPFRICVGRLT